MVDQLGSQELASLAVPAVKSKSSALGIGSPLGWLCQGRRYDVWHRKAFLSGTCDVFHGGRSDSAAGADAKAGEYRAQRYA